MKKTFLIEIVKSEIDRCSTDRLVEFFRELAALPDGKLCNSIKFRVSGYDQDPRELGEITQVRAYFKHLYQRVPSLLYWLDLESEMPLFLATVLLPTVKLNGRIGVEEGHLLPFLEQGLTKMKEYCHESGISSAASEQAGRIAIDLARKSFVRTERRWGTLPSRRRPGHAAL